MHTSDPMSGLIKFRNDLKLVLEFWILFTNYNLEIEEQCKFCSFLLFCFFFWPGKGIFKAQQ